MVETECHDVCVSCTGVDTLHQLTPCSSPFGLDYQYALHSSPWQQNGKGKNTEKSSVIHRQQETHTPLYTNMHAHMHTSTLVHTCIFMYTYTTTHAHTHVHIYTDVTHRTNIQVPYGESSSSGCTQKTLRQASAPFIPLRDNKIQEKHQGREVREQSGSIPIKHTRAAFPGGGH